ncbi:MAG: ATP synthase F1 subunit epsilon [Bacteroidetes bacterium]|nr:ATP synthase F1 subunit epsilon [Bacteroidota bacterium]
MYLKIINPEKVIFEQKITKVTLPGKEGAFQVLKNHAPIISFLSEGTIKGISNNKSFSFEISNGIAKVNNNNITVLIE